MAKHIKKHISLIPLLIVAIIITVLIGTIIKILPLLNTPSQQQKIAGTYTFTQQDLQDLQYANKAKREVTIKGQKVKLSDIYIDDTLGGCIDANRYFNFALAGQNRSLSVDEANIYFNDECKDETGKDPQDRIDDEIENPNLAECIEGVDYTVCRPVLTGGQTFPKDPSGRSYIDESVKVVRVTFTGLRDLAGKKIYYCLENDIQNCNDNDKWKDYGSDADNIILNTLCGNGPHTLKEGCGESGEGNWFHPGNVYRVFVSQADKKENAQANVVATASFYVSRIYPTIDSFAGVAGTNLPKAINGRSAIANSIKVPSSPTLNLPLKLTGRNNKEGESPVFGGLQASDQHNDYFIEVISQSTDYKTPGECIFVPSTGTGERNILLPKDFVTDDGIAVTLTPGTYTLRITDGKGGNLQPGQAANCSKGNFVYYDIPFKVGEGNTPGAIAMPIKDPYQKELVVKTVAPTPVPVCPTTAMDPSGNCTVINTGLGIPIRTNPRLFMTDLFRVVLSIGGIAAVVFFIQAGYTIMNSAGNKEKVGQAREQITAAIMGLLFLILSYAILEFIGFNILRIPGFGTPTETKAPITAPGSGTDVEDLRPNP